MLLQSIERTPTQTWIDLTVDLFCSSDSELCSHRSRSKARQLSTPIRRRRSPDKEVAERRTVNSLVGGSTTPRSGGDRPRGDPKGEGAVGP
jgi:hypothetical protein